MLVVINRIQSILVILSILLFGISCKKFVDIDSPLSNVDASVVYGNDASAIAVMTGLYNRMSSENNFATGQFSVSTIAAVTSDELKVNSTSTEMFSQAYTNSLNSLNAPFWTKIYNYLYTTNSVIEGINASTGISDPVRQQILGEALFMRAFFHFYLVNLFGDAPISISTDYRIIMTSSRNEKKMVYEQIVSDLKEAQELLNSNFMGVDAKTTSTERVRPNKWAAMALLARVYLYLDDWVNAESLSTNVIANTVVFGLVKDLNSVFLKNSREAIWQLQPVINGYNTQDARYFILTTAPTSTNPFELSSMLYNTFEANDNRKVNWVGSILSGGVTYYYPNKYKKGNFDVTQPVVEYSMVLRLSEQYLIRAEARAKQNNLVGAIVDLDTIRSRANLPALANNLSSDKVLSAIEQERRVELFTEWGHRWFDLKRTNRIDAVMIDATTKKGGVWNTNWQYYPIPLIDIQRNKSLKQNTGYN